MLFESVMHYFNFVMEELMELSQISLKVTTFGRSEITPPVHLLQSLIL